MSHPLVLLQKHGRTAILKFNSDKNLNALTESVGQTFYQHVQQLKQDPKLNAVILTGEGRAFSAGGDLNFLKDRLKTPYAENVDIMKRFYGYFLSIRELPVPTIAAINGTAVGAGFCLALACDMRIAAKDVKVGVNFARLGIHPGMGGSYFLPKIVGHGHACRLLLTGELISSDEGQTMGLFLKTVDKEQVLSQALELAEQLGQSSSVSVRATLKTLRTEWNRGLEDALRVEADVQSQTDCEPDLKEGLQAVIEKRKPVYTSFY